jgi:hypothetical protein
MFPPALFLQNARQLRRSRPGMPAAPIQRSRPKRHYRFSRDHFLNFVAMQNAALEAPRFSFFAYSTVIPRASAQRLSLRARSEPGISRFPDAQLRI